MFLRTLTLLTAISVLTSSAFAQVEPDSFHLMGRGVSKKSNAESLALACIDSACDEVQFLYFAEGKSPQWVGRKIKTPLAPSDELKEKSLQLEVAYYLSGLLAEQKSDSKTLRYILGIGAPVIVATAGLGVIPFLATGLVAGVVFIVRPSSSLSSMMTNAGDVSLTANASDTHGWNWSIEPKKINDKKFSSLLNALRHGGGIYSIGSGGEIDRILNRMRKLEEKEGVVFRQTL